jgi:hypothetical protein
MILSMTFNTFQGLSITGIEEDMNRDVDEIKYLAHLLKTCLYKDQLEELTTELENYDREGS